MNESHSTGRVLVVDDEPDLLTLYELSLLREGHEVETAASVGEAWDLLQQRRFSLVITDMRLPDGSGMTLMHKLEQAHRPEKVIVITAYGSAENAVEALKAGAFDYLTKPVDLRQFRSVVAAALGRVATPVPPAQPAGPLSQSALARLAFIRSGQAAGLTLVELGSVLDQSYPNLLYVVQDGGSKDGSVEVIRRHADRLHAWASEKDAGQADAIRRGFARVESELGPDDVMAWLNSDDLLAPGSLAFVAGYFASHPEVDAIYGHRIIIDEADGEIGRWVMPRHDPETLEWIDYVHGTFAGAGPGVRYNMGRGGYGGFGRMPNYSDLMTESDSLGTHRSYLATDESYATLRDMQERNVIVPFTGDFAGTKALKAFGDYVRANKGVVQAIYVSNVEQYLKSLGLRGAYEVSGDGRAQEQGAKARRVNVTVVAAAAALEDGGRLVAPLALGADLERRKHHGILGADGGRRRRRDVWSNLRERREPEGDKQGG